MIRFLHTSDWQLGMTRHFLQGEAQHRFAQARLDAIRNLGKIAKEKECAFIVVAGDVFETNQVNRQTIGRAAEALQACEVPVYLLPGNHDPIYHGSVFRSTAFKRQCPPHVHVFEGTEPYYPVEGVAVYGAPWRSNKPTEDLVASAIGTLDKSQSTYRILVGHGGISSLAPSLEDPALVWLDPAEKAIREGTIHYLALGDRHSLTSVGSTGRIYYSGAPEPTDYREENPGKTLVVTLDSDSIDVEEVHVGTWQFHSLAFRLESGEDLTQMQEDLMAIPSKERGIVKLQLVGSLDLQQWAQLEKIKDDARTVFAAVEDWDRHTDLHLIPRDTDFSDLGLTGYAAEARDRLLEQCQGGDPIAEDALRLLLRMARADS